MTQQQTTAQPKRWIDTLTSEQRKTCPVASGVLDYFPDAIAMVAHVSWVGNAKHNPGQPLHHARSKSGDEADAMMRHFLSRDDVDVVYLPEIGEEIELPHRALVAWRALSDLQKWMEQEFCLPLPAGAKP